jgi:Calcineurin-like phosphoesterase
MVDRIERTPVDYPFRFVIAGDSGAWADPTADGIFSELVRQIAALDPAPLFFANLGDFAGPGTIERHEHYLRLVEALPIPDICVIGNHDLDDTSGWAVFERVHGPMNFAFGYGHTRFIALHAEPGDVGDMHVSRSEGPRDDDLAFLERALEAADEPHRVVLMHMPPYLNGRYAPHADWGFQERESEFLSLLRAHDVKLVCCAHGLAFRHARARRDPVHHVRRRRDRSLLALPRRLHGRGGAPRGSRQSLPRRRDHDLGGRGGLGPDHPGL